MATILIIDDDLNTCQALTLALSKEGHQILEAHSGKEALEKIRSQEADLAVIDLKLPGMSGLEFFQTLKTLRPEIIAIMISAHATVDQAVGALKSGIYDFVTKPFRIQEIKRVVAKGLEARALLLENRRLRQALKEKAAFSRIIGKSSAFVHIMDVVTKVAPTRSTVVLFGESGTGKELIAEAIHFGSPRMEAPLIKLNCGALTETLLESELFGHERGAFTGAYQQRLGRFELASGGTLFLDEISEMSLAMQVKLLRVLQDGAFERVGGNRTIQVDVRVIAATNKDLEREVREGRFRKDLFYRINVITIEIPPLRDRRDDIPLLANHFLKKYAELNRKEALHFSDEAMRRLVDYDWPGNVRELENAVERAVSLCQSDTIDLSDLPPGISNTPRSGEFYMVPFGSTLDEIEKMVIEKTLARTRGDKKVTANMLGISLSSLYNKLTRKAR